MPRDRRQGWVWAKMSGHVNEKNVCELFNDKKYCKQFAEALSIPAIQSASVGGLREKSVSTVLGKRSRGKTDLRLSCENGQHFNFSIKKSLAGQVFLITIDHFILGFEKQFNVTIPNDSKRLIISLTSSPFFIDNNPFTFSNTNNLGFNSLRMR